jgi:hypothetical protein
MAMPRPRITSHIGLPYDLLVTDSVVLDEEAVAETLAADETDAPRGDVIDGVKYGLIFSTCIWAVIFLTAYFVFH